MDRFTNFLAKYEDENIGKPENYESQVTTAATTKNTVPDKVHWNVKDEVCLGDLEKAVEYSIMKEVAMQPVLDAEKLQTLVY